MTQHDDDFGDAEHATAEVRPKVPAIVERIGAPTRGVFTTPAPRRAYLVEQVARFTDDDGNTKRIERHGVIGRGQLHILAGEGGSGKGRWLLAIAAALAASASRRDPDPAAMCELDLDGGMDNVCGLSVNGIEDNEKVLLLLGEDDAIDFHQRCEGVAEVLGFKDPAREDRFIERMRWGSAHGLTFSIVTARKADGGIMVNASTDFLGLVEWMKENGPWAFVGLDPMARFAGVDESDNPLQHQVYSLVETLTAINGEGVPAPAVVVVDHTTKPSDGRGEAPSQHWIRGASAKVNAARVAMIMVPGGNKVAVDSEGRRASDADFDETSGTAKVGIPLTTWHVVKNNGQPKADPVELTFSVHGGLVGESVDVTRARRKRQWHAAKARGEVNPPKAAGTKTRKADRDARMPSAGDDA